MLAPHGATESNGPSAGFAGASYPTPAVCNKSDEAVLRFRADGFWRFEEGEIASVRRCEAERSGCGTVSRPCH